MAKFKVIVSDPEDGKSKAVELDGARAVPLIGKRLGETVDGSVVGMAGRKLLLTGGSDKDGFPMRRNIHGGVRVNVVVSKSVGFHPKREGERQRKTLRGSVITEDVVQVNAKVIEKIRRGAKPKKPPKIKAEAAKPEKSPKVEAHLEPQLETAEAAEAPPKSGGEPSEKAAQTT
jgi:small subunit ribosomal protein S6e